MKTKINALISIGCVFIILIAPLYLLTINVKAYDPAMPFVPFDNETDRHSDQNEYIEIWTNENIEKNFIVKNNQNIRITSLRSTNGKLVINNGVTATIKGDIFIERGGLLEIDDGTVVISGGNITNCGTIKIGEKGMLKVLNGTLNSTSAGNIQNDGKITCLTSDKKLERCFKCIKKFDDRFDLSDYSLLIDSDEKSASVTTSYCIDDIMTNYRYKFEIDPNVKKTKIVRSDYSLETVYSLKTVQNLQELTSTFEKDHAKELNFKMWYWKNYGYTYNYKNNELVFNAKWFSYDDKNDKFIENDYSEKV